MKSFFLLSKSETFAEAALVLGEISFLILLDIDIGSLLISSPENLHFTEDSPGNKLTNHRSFRILLLLFDWSTNPMC